MDAPNKTEIAVTLFLHDPSILTLGVLCETGDFGDSFGAFPRRQILALAKATFKISGLTVSVGRGLPHVRQTRRVLRRDTGRDVTTFYNPSNEISPGQHNPRDFREEHEIKVISVPTFSIQVGGPNFRYTFKAAPENLRRAPCVDLEALHLKIKGP